MAKLEPGKSVSQTFSLGKIPSNVNYAGEKATVKVTATRPEPENTQTNSGVQNNGT